MLVTWSFNWLPLAPNKFQVIYFSSLKGDDV